MKLEPIDTSTTAGKASAPEFVWVEVCAGTPMDVHKMPKTNDGYPKGWEVIRYRRVEE